MDGDASAVNGPRNTEGFPARQPAPIVLFTYCRPDHTRRTIEALRRNRLADASDLIVYSDAPRSPEELPAVEQVRSYLDTVTGFRSVTIFRRTTNFGLSKSIIEGVTDQLGVFERVIVLEDDMVTSPHFLTFMNDALNRFGGDERVASIHGYVFPIGEALPEAFFVVGADCWGWATWRAAWSTFVADGQVLLDQLTARGLLEAFDYGGSYPFSEMLRGQIRGDNDSWAIRWYASAFLAGKLTLYPGRSLVRNTGCDGSGTHCGSQAEFDVQLSQTPIDLEGLVVEPSPAGRLAFERYFRAQRPGPLRRLARNARSLLRRAWSARR